MMKNSFRCLFLFGVLVSLLGCVSKDLTEDKRFIRNKYINNDHPRATLITAGKALLNTVEIVNPVFKEVGAMTAAEVTLQNLTNGPFKVQYRFRWQDMQGFSTGNEGVWKMLYISPGDAVPVSSTSKTPGGKMIVFTIRNPRDLFEDLRKAEDKKREEYQK